MYTITKLSIFMSLIVLIKSTYLEAESNYKPKLERNNILNKGLWVRKSSEAKSGNDFIFNANSLEVDNILQDNDAFNDVNIKSSPFFTAYAGRSKRSIPQQQLKRRRKSLNVCKDNECSIPDDVTKIKISNLQSTLNPLSKVDDPLKDISVNVINVTDDKNKTNDINSVKNATVNKINIVTYLNNDYINGGINNISREKSASLVIKKVKLPEAFNDTEYANVSKTVNSIKVARHQKYENVKTNDSVKYSHEHLNTSKTRPITDKGLLKILTMLTKTFKRILKQHSDIKTIHNKLHNLNTDFMRHLETLTEKFSDFDRKYRKIIKISEKITEKDKHLKDEQKFLLNKQNELSNKLIEFDKQQKKFLLQQQQFYSVQKQMLQRNEHISLKQSLIAKTQSEISQRQNYFARIFKKAQHISKDAENATPTKTNKSTIMIKTDKEYSKTTTTPTPQDEFVKINLFSIPPLKKLHNQDKDILKEKDNQLIDDLVYKYYFNNTVIDDIMKNKILTNLLTSGTNHITSKRKPRLNPNTTILLPVNNSDLPHMTRNRRWIRHSKKKVHKKETEVPVPEMPKRVKIVKDPKTEEYPTDPFLKMAMTFCTEVGQVQNVKYFNWCVEKTLRRLKVIDVRVISTLNNEPNVASIKNTIIGKLRTNTLRGTSTVKQAPSTKSPNNQETATESLNKTVFFPDNDELEINLKEYDLTPDTEGNVYYEGSLHASEMDFHDTQDSEGFSDIIPGLNSDSRVHLDPVAIDLQAHRFPDVRRIKDKLMRVKMA